MSWQWIEDGQGDRNTAPAEQANAQGMQTQLGAQGMQQGLGGMKLWNNGPQNANAQMGGMQQSGADQSANVASMAAAQGQAFGTQQPAQRQQASYGQPAQQAQAGYGQPRRPPINHTFDKWSMFGGRGKPQMGGMQQPGAQTNIDGMRASQLAANAPKGAQPAQSTQPGLSNQEEMIRRQRELG